MPVNLLVKENPKILNVRYALTTFGKQAHRANNSTGRRYRCFQCMLKSYTLDIDYYAINMLTHSVSYLTDNSATKLLMPERYEERSNFYAI